MTYVIERLKMTMCVFLPIFVVFYIVSSLIWSGHRDNSVPVLVAACIDPATHVRVQHDEEVEDHQPDEKDNN